MVPRPRRSCTRGETRRSRRWKEADSGQTLYLARARGGAAGYLSPLTPVDRSVYLPEKLMAMCEYLLPLGTTPRHLHRRSLPPSPPPPSLPLSAIRFQSKLYLQQQQHHRRCVSPIISRNRNRHRDAEQEGSVVGTPWLRSRFNCFSERNRERGAGPTGRSLASDDDDYSVISLDYYSADNSRLMMSRAPD